MKLFSRLVEKYGNVGQGKKLSRKIEKLRQEKARLFEELNGIQRKKRLVKNLLAIDAELRKAEQEKRIEEDKKFVSDAIKLLKETSLLYTECPVGIGIFITTKEWRPLTSLESIDIDFPSNHKVTFNLLKWFETFSLREQKALAVRFLSLCRDSPGATELILPAIPCPLCQKKEPHLQEAVQIKLKRAA
jgi:hypothetical protein